MKKLLLLLLFIPLVTFSQKLKSVEFFDASSIIDKSEWKNYKNPFEMNELKTELQLEFGKDLWDKCLEKQRGKGTTEDMYWWYKKQRKMGQTPSELAIRLGRKTTKGLR